MKQISINSMKQHCPEVNTFCLAENMIFQTNDIELLIKKNSDNAVNIMSDFIITNSKQSSNGL